MQCVTCKHWRDRINDIRARAPGGLCLLSVPGGTTAMIATAVTGEWAVLWTQPTFGCVLHEGEP